MCCFISAIRKLTGIVGDIIASINKASQVLSGGNGMVATYSMPEKTKIKLSRQYISKILFMVSYFNMPD